MNIEYYDKVIEGDNMVVILNELEYYFNDDNLVCIAPAYYYMTYKNMMSKYVFEIEYKFLDGMLNEYGKEIILDIADK